MPPGRSDSPLLLPAEAPKYTGPLDENGFPVGLPNEISEYMKQQGEPPSVPKIIFKKNEPKEGNEI